MEKILNIEEIEKLDRACGDCGTELNDDNRSGWFGFYAEGNIAIELCCTCNEHHSKGGEKEDAH
jgi:hypothetical protein